MKRIIQKKKWGEKRRRRSRSRNSSGISCENKARPTTRLQKGHAECSVQCWCGVGWLCDTTTSTETTTALSTVSHAHTHTEKESEGQAHAGSDNCIWLHFIFIYLFIYYLCTICTVHREHIIYYIVYFIYFIYNSQHTLCQSQFVHFMWGAINKKLLLLLFLRCFVFLNFFYCCCGCSSNCCFMLSPHSVCMRVCVRERTRFKSAHYRERGQGGGALSSRAQRNSCVRPAVRPACSVVKHQQERLWESECQSEEAAGERQRRRQREPAVDTASTEIVCVFSTSSWSSALPALLLLLLIQINARHFVCVCCCYCCCNCCKRLWT